MKRKIRLIGDGWLIDGNQRRTENALAERGLVERVSAYGRRGILLTWQGVETYWKLREENDD